MSIFRYKIIDSFLFFQFSIDFNNILTIFMIVIKLFVFLTIGVKYYVSALIRYQA